MMKGHGGATCVIREPVDRGGDESVAVCFELCVGGGECVLMWFTL